MLYVDVSSMDYDVSPANWPCLIATLTEDIFQTVTPFDNPFAPLEILRHALCDHVVLTKFLEILIFSLSLSVEAILNVLSCLYEF
jgi:hypothetical protein